MVSYLYYGMGILIWYGLLFVLWNGHEFQIHELVFPKDPNVSFVSIVLANHHITQNLYPSSSRRKEIDLLCKGFTIGFFGFSFFPSLNSKEEEQRNKLFALLNQH